jgi:hypothetical protein
MKSYQLVKIQDLLECIKNAIENKALPENFTELIEFEEDELVETLNLFEGVDFTCINRIGYKPGASLTEDFGGYEIQEGTAYYPQINSEPIAKVNQCGWGNGVTKEEALGDMVIGLVEESTNNNLIIFSLES